MLLAFILNLTLLSWPPKVRVSIVMHDIADTARYLHFFSHFAGRNFSKLNSLVRLSLPKAASFLRRAARLGLAGHVYILNVRLIGQRGGELGVCLLCKRLLIKGRARLVLCGEFGLAVLLRRAI